MLKKTLAIALAGFVMATLFADLARAGKREQKHPQERHGNARELDQRHDTSSAAERAGGS